MIPSTRQTLDHAAALQAQRSADVLLAMAEFEQELGIDAPDLCAEHQAVALRLAELHLCIDHLVANLRGGHGVPPTPAPPAPRPGMRPVTHVKPDRRPVQQLAQWNARTPGVHKPAPAARPAAKRPPKHAPKRDPEQMRAAGSLGGAALRRKHQQRAAERAAAGQLNAREAAAHCGFSVPGWYAALYAGRLPAPHSHPALGKTLWRAAELAGIEPEPRRRRADPATAAQRADGLLTRDQARAVTGYSVPGFSLARRTKHVPEPHTHEGRHPLWRPEQLVGIYNRRAKAAA